MSEDPAGSRPAGQPPLDPDEAIRLGRRRFFRAFVSDAVRTAANVAGVAGALQRTSAEVAGAILSGADLGAAGATSAPAGPAPFTVAHGGGSAIAAVPAAAGAAQPGVHASRSPFRFESDGIILLDQRRLPDELLEVVCRNAPDVRVAILEGVVRGASTLAQVAAAALALAAASAADSRPYARRAIIAGSANSLRAAAGSAAPVRRALARMTAVVDRRSDLFDDGPGLAVALRAEAEALIGEATLAHAALGGHGIALFEAVPEATGLPLRILTLGSVGALAGGQVGTVLAVVNRLVADGRPVEVVVCETRPALTGTRLTAWELAASGTPYELIPDVGAGALIAGGEVDIVMVGADAIAANGDVLADAGTCALALLAARHGVPFAVVAPAWTLDPEQPDGSDFRAEPRPAHDVLGVAGRRLAPAGAIARNPGLDVTPADLVGAIVTEHGVLAAPLAEGLAGVAAALRARDEASSGAPPPTEGAGAADGAVGTHPAAGADGADPAAGMEPA